MTQEGTNFSPPVNDQGQQNPGADFFKPQASTETPSPAPAPEPTPSPDSSPQPSVDEAWARQFEQYAGVDFSTFMDTFSSLYEDYQTRQEQAFKSQLREKLGEEGFDEKFNRVNERFTQLSPKAQDFLLEMPPIERTLYLHNILEAESNINGKPEVPTLDSNTDGGVGGKKVWKRSEVRSLTPEKYRELAAEIDLARREGRYEDDI